ncbi:hypothetical protein [Microbulbifer sp. JMSA003]|uniref:hypothetical protein n=1 Tax=unclassified Microbulbifer TaxID=2619833 RepID=UPI00403A427A
MPGVGQLSHRSAHVSGTVPEIQNDPSRNRAGGNRGTFSKLLESAKKWFASAVNALKRMIGLQRPERALNHRSSLYQAQYESQINEGVTQRSVNSRITHDSAEYTAEASEITIEDPNKAYPLVPEHDPTSFEVPDATKIEDVPDEEKNALPVAGEFLLATNGD